MTTSLDAHRETLSSFDPHQSAASHHFDMGLVVPAQFYDLIRRSPFLDGETRLVFAVLEDAVRTYLRQRDSRRRADRVEFAEVARWFSARSGRAPFSFEYICEVLELQPESFRRQLSMMRSDALPTKQLRSVGRSPRVRSARYIKKRSSWEA